MIFDCIRRKTKTLLLTGIVILVGFFVYADEATAPPKQPPYGVTFQAKVVRVVDGDTIEVEVKKVVRIRLLDCWAPETRTRDAAEKLKGFAAKEHLEGLIQNREVKVHIPMKPGQKVGDSFSFGRALGHVWLKGEGKSVSAIMVKSGHATKTRNE